MPPKLKLKSTPKSRLAGLFLLLLLFNCFLSVGLIYYLRRSKTSTWNRSLRRVAQPPQPPQVQTQMQANPIVLLSREIEAALVAGDHRRFAELIQAAHSDALYSYSTTNLGKHFIQMAPWSIPVLEALVDAKHIHVNRNCILHGAIKAFNESPDHSQYIEALLSKHAADIDLPDGSGFAPLVYAVRRASLPATQFLLSRGAKVNVPFASYSSILHYAVAIGSADKMIAMLVKNGGNPFHRGPDGLTPFHRSMFLATSDRINIMTAFIDTTPSFFTDPQRYRKRLLNYPISPTAVHSPSQQTFYGYTPLHLAVEKLRSNQLVKILLRKGADRGTTENGGFTPLDLARLIQHQDIIQTLTSE